jgi:RHS repeat-associated protein
MTYPSARVVNLNHDGSGRMSSLTDQFSSSYVSGIGYNSAEQVTGWTLGNGVAETFGYDTNRLQMTSQSATRGATTLMSLTYGYNALAGQNGAGSTAGNSGQLMSVSGTINGATESASYTYDLIGRLATSTQISNGASAQRRFAYDRWGNRTGVWNATSGGTQIQSVTLQQSGGLPTNRIATVGSTSYSYDSAGNVTNDGVHSYTYDAENRVVSVDSGAATYSYDERNWRVKKTVGSSVTHYIWEGGQVLAEHNGSTGAVIVDYIYAGGRMIAKEDAGARRYFLSDRLSVRVSLDTGGNVVGRQGHLPFGEDFAESGTQQKQHLTSYERDAESGLDYAVNRYHSSNAGRFSSVDPVTGGIASPQSLNRYSYVQNDPVNLVDPDGRLLGIPYISPDVILDAFSVTLSTTESYYPDFGWGVGIGGPIGAPTLVSNPGIGGGFVTGPEPEPEPDVQRFIPGRDNDCKGFAGFLKNLAKEYRGRSFKGDRLGVQLGLWAPQYVKSDPTTGFKQPLYYTGALQGGELYKHVLAFAGLTVKSGFGDVAANIVIKNALELDAAQVASGRKESQAELNDDYAGIAVGELLVKALNNQISGRELKRRAKSLLCE